MAQTQAYRVRSKFSKTAQHVFYNKVIKFDMRSGNGNLQHLKCILQGFEINIFFPLDGFSDGPTIKTAFLYYYVHFCQFLVKHAIAM